MVRIIARWTTIASTIMACAFALAAGAQDSRPKKKKSGSAPAASKWQDKELGGLVRSYAQNHRVDLALMNGLEALPVEAPGPKYRNNSKEYFEKAVLGAGGVFHDSGPFRFIVPESPLYGPLTRYSLTGRIDPGYAGVNATLQIGSGTPIYNALALLGYVLDRTIIADNTIADQPTGEIGLFDVPMTGAIEAILKSARVPEEAFAVLSTKEFILIHSPATAPKIRDTATMPDYLSRRMSLTLPTPTLNERQFPASEVMPLHAVLASLARQLEVPVEVDRSLRDLPVTPMHMSRVTIATALDLLLAQWPVNDIAIDTTAERIIVRPAE